MERLIETLATGLGGSVGWMAENGALFVVFAVIWVAFGVGIVWRQGTLDRAWQRIQSLPLLARVVVWLLFLPVMIGLWIWESAWPRLVRLVLVLGLAGWNLLVFRPV
jgi:hypothetical protein